MEAGRPAAQAVDCQRLTTIFLIDAFFACVFGSVCHNDIMTSKQRMKSWEDLEVCPKPSWETWKRILRMPHIDHDPKRASEQWEKINKRKKTGLTSEAN